LLRNYARWLGLDAAKVMALYESATTAPKSKKRKTRGKKRRTAEIPAPAKITDTPPALPKVTLAEQRDRTKSRTRRAFSTLVMMLVAVAAVAIIVYVSADLMMSDDATATPTVENAALLAVLQAGDPTPTYTPTWTPVAFEPSATPLAALSFSGTGVSLQVEFAQRAWVRINVDGDEQYAGLVRPMDLLEFEAVNQITLTSSNAAALDVTYNGRQQDAYGERGQAVTITFTPGNINVQ